MCIWHATWSTPSAGRQRDMRSLGVAGAAGLAVVLLGSGATGSFAQSRLQGLPDEIRTEVEQVRKACAEYMASFVPADEMQGVERIRLAGRPAILVDHQSLCYGRRATVNCSNRGC